MLKFWKKAFIPREKKRALQKSPTINKPALATLTARRIISRRYAEGNKGLSTSCCIYIYIHPPQRRHERLDCIPLKTPCAIYCITEFFPSYITLVLLGADAAVYMYTEKVSRDAIDCSILLSPSESIGIIPIASLLHYLSVRCRRVIIAAVLF